MPNQVSPLHLLVETESGQQLGHVIDIELDPDSQKILAYIVKTKSLLSRMTRSALIIAPSQVISISEEKMVVENSLITNQATSFATEATA